MKYWSPVPALLLDPINSLTVPWATLTMAPSLSVSPWKSPAKSSSWLLHPSTWLSAIVQALLWVSTTWPHLTSSSPWLLPPSSPSWGASHFLFVQPRVLAPPPLGYEGRIQGKKMRTEESKEQLFVHWNILDHSEESLQCIISCSKWICPYVVKL